MGWLQGHDLRAFFMDMLQCHNSIRGRIGNHQAAGHGLSVDLEPDITCHAHVSADCATREAMETAQRPCINGPVDDTAASPYRRWGPILVAILYCDQDPTAGGDLPGAGSLPAPTINISPLLGSEPLCNVSPVLDTFIATGPSFYLL
jgi:hypothetical protein